MRVGSESRTSASGSALGRGARQANGVPGTVMVTATVLRTTRAVVVERRRIRHGFWGLVARGATFTSTGAGARSGRALIAAHPQRARGSEVLAVRTSPSGARASRPGHRRATRRCSSAGARPRRHARVRLAVPFGRSRAERSGGSHHEQVRIAAHDEAQPEVVSRPRKPIRVETAGRRGAGDAVVDDADTFAPAYEVGTVEARVDAERLRETGRTGAEVAGARPRPPGAIRSRPSSGSGAQPRVRNRTGPHTCVRTIDKCIT